MGAFWGYFLEFFGVGLSREAEAGSGGAAPVFVTRWAGDVVYLDSSEGTLA